MRFSAEFIEQVRDANNIVDFIGQHTQLKPSSGGFMGRCPFPDHQEKTPSFSVSESKQVYYCFGCHKKGNIFKFVQEFMGLGFSQAVEYLADRANLALPEQSQHNDDRYRQFQARNKALIQLNQWAVEYFVDNYRNLTPDHPVRQYTQKQRGLSEDLIAEFKIGYAPKEWDGLVHYLQKKGASLTLAEEARLIKKRPGASAAAGAAGYHDVFRERLMFPIFSPMNEPLAFGGRVIFSGEPKYLNSGETPVFNKGKVLYGMSQTARYIRSDDFAVVVEGYMDLVSLYQAGIKTAVAPMGTALTSDQCRLLSRLSKNVVVLFDGDAAGQRAAERSLPLLLAAQMYPRGLILPSQMDPDDFVKAQGAQALQAMLDSAKDLFTLMLEIWTVDYHGEASEKVKLSDLLRPVFASMQDLRLKKLYMQESARKIGVSEAWLREALQTPAAAKTTEQAAVEALHLSPLTDLLAEGVSDSTAQAGSALILQGASQVELIMMALALKSLQNFQFLQNQGAMQMDLHPGVRGVLENAAVVSRQNPENFAKLAGLLSSFVDQPELLFVDNELQRRNEIEIETKMLNDCLKRMKAQSLKKQAEQLSADIKRQPTAEKMEQLMNIQRDRLALSKES